MASLKIGIVEDDLLIAESIYVTLQQIGYNPVRPVRNCHDAITMIESEKPDLLLVDIILETEPDGIQLADTINKHYGIPFIFLTANSDGPTITKAKQVNPYAYIVKPFTESDLFSAIEVAFSNFQNNRNTNTLLTSAANIPQDFVLVKEGDVYYKVPLATILHLESDNVYLQLHTASKKFLVRQKMDDFVQAYPAGNFQRTHRSYAVNLTHVESIGVSFVKVKSVEVPLQKPYRDELLKRFSFVK